MITDRNGKQIKEGDWIAYKYGENGEIGGLQVVSQNGVLGVLQSSFFGAKVEVEFIDLSTTDLKHCEVVEHGKKED